VLPILAVNFVGTLGYSIVLPFLVFLVTRFGGNPVVYGVIGATYSGFQLLGAPLLGRWSDRVGRKRVLLASQAGTFAAWAIFLAAFTLPLHPLASVDSTLLGRFTITVPLLLVFLARAVDGLTGGNVSVANAYLADITTDADRAANYGRLALSSNLGFVIGPAVAGVLGATASGEWATVLAALLVSGAALVLIQVTLPDVPAAAVPDPVAVPTVHDVLGGDRKECYRLPGRRRGSRWNLVSLPGVGLLLALQGLVFVAFNVYYVAFPVWAASGLHWSLGGVGLYFSVMSLLMAVVEGPVLGRLGRRWSDRGLVVGGGLLLGAGFMLLASPRGAVIYAGTGLLALGNGLMWPSLLSAVSKASPRGDQGAIQGLSGSLTALASIIGLLAGGALYQGLGAGVFLLSALGAGAAAILAVRIPAGPERSRPSAPEHG